ncbi:MAG: hypothetical protein Q9187_001229 [Circinaria calcarea]
MALCMSCGALLQIIEYQSRAGDEAHTTVTVCSQCPIRADKLDFEKAPHDSFQGFYKQLKRRKLSSVRNISVDGLKAYLMTIDTLYENLRDKEYPSNEQIVQKIRMKGRRGSGHGKESIIEGYYTVNGPLLGTCTRLESRRSVGFGIWIETYELYNSPVRREEDRLIVRALFEPLSTYKGHRRYAYVDQVSSKTKQVFDLGTKEPTALLCEQIVNSAYLSGSAPQKLRLYLGEDSISRLSNLSPRGWDASAVPVTGYSIAPKPDGQRVWLIWYMNMWYVTKPRVEPGKLSWSWSRTQAPTSLPVIIDAEYMPSKGYIVNDFLTDINGAYAPASRDISWIEVNYDALAKLRPPISVLLKPYFRDATEAREYCSLVNYPTDGLVAIRDSSTEILKIKDFKSVELRLDDTMMFCTAEGSPVFRCPNSKNLAVESIVEIKFSEGLTSGSIRIVDMFERTDKAIPNSSAAVSNILFSMSSLNTKDDNERRVALLWCNEIRNFVVNRSKQLSPSKSIILDVGTGSGQSLDSIQQDETLSYIFMEPDLDACKSLARRIRAKHIISSTAEIRSMIRGLKTRSILRIVVNMTLRQLMDDSETFESLLTEVKCVTCTFSIHYLLRDLRDLKARCDIPVLGCGYLYDGTRPDGVLIDCSGVKMKRISDTEAEVRWGRDTKYVEPVTFRRHYAGLGRVLQGSDLVSLPDPSLSPNAVQICRHVFVLV